MSIKRMLMLASMALAALAFAAPAQANLTWDGEEIHGTGELTSVNEAGFFTGPAPVTFSGSVEDEGTTGLITSFEVNNEEGGIPTAIPGCTARATADQLPWVTHLETPDTLVITDMTFTKHYTGASCGMFGVPDTVSVDGDVTLTVTSPHSADADPYNDSNTLFIENEGQTTTAGIDIRGQVHWEGATVVGLP